MSHASARRLTVLAVVGDLHFALLGAPQSLAHLVDGLLVRVLAVEEVAGARLLHDVRPGEAGHLAEAVVAVDDGTVFHPGVGYYEFTVCNGRVKWGGGAGKRNVRALCPDLGGAQQPLR